MSAKHAQTPFQTRCPKCGREPCIGSAAMGCLTLPPPHDWIDAKKRLPSKSDIGKGFICTLQPKSGKRYTAEMCWLGGEGKNKWHGDWSGEVVAWSEFPAPFTRSLK